LKLREQKQTGTTETNRSRFRNPHQSSTRSTPSSRNTMDSRTKSSTSSLTTTSSTRGRRGRFGRRVASGKSDSRCRGLRVPQLDAAGGASIPREFSRRWTIDLPNQRRTCASRNANTCGSVLTKCRASSAYGVCPTITSRVALCWTWRQARWACSECARRA